MGQCGCGDFTYNKAHKVGGKILAQQIYYGCQYCDTPAGVVLHLMSPKEAKNWGVTPEGHFPMDTDSKDYGMLCIPVIHPTQLVEAARHPEFESMCGEIDLSEYDSLAELLQDIGLPLLQVAMDLTQAKHSGKEVQTT